VLIEVVNKVSGRAMIVEELADYILATQFRDLSGEVVSHAKNEIIDIIGCTIGGANAPGCLPLLDLVRSWGGREESTVLVHGLKAPAHNVAMVNSIMARSYDYEVCAPVVKGTVIPAHISATTIPAAFATGEQKERSGKEIITATVLGNDIASRILAASNYSMDSPWDCTGTVNMFGATTVASKLLGLNRDQLLNAFGIVVNQLAGSFQSLWDGAHTFKLHQGLASRAGIFSAELASNGFTGVRDPLLSKLGYFAIYCESYDPRVLTEELGKTFYAEAWFKKYPCCAGNHAAIDCALKLVHENEIRPEHIDEVIVTVPPWICESFLNQPFDFEQVPQVKAAFNLPYNAANALLRKTVKLEHFTSEAIKDPEVVELAQKVKLVAEIPSEKARAIGMKVKMKDGAEFSTYVEAPIGEPIHAPLTTEEIKRKFQANVAFSGTVRDENAKEALKMIENLDGVDRVTRIVDRLIACN